VTAITPRQWGGLLGVLGLQDEVAALEGELGVRFDREEGMRFAHRDRLMPLVEAAIGRRTAADLAPALDAQAVCWAPYRTLAEALATDPQLSPANPLLAEIDHPSGQRYLAPGAAGFSPQAPRHPPEPAPRLGEHTSEVLSNVLGLSAQEIARLREAGVVGGGADG